MAESKGGVVPSPYDLDATSFDPDQYLNKLLKECTLKQIMDVEAVVVKETQTLHSDMQTLVYENYNKFITATDTIRQMKSDFNRMESEMNQLMGKMSKITQFSDQITGTLQGTRTQLNKLSGKHALLKRLQFLSTLPAKLKSLIDEGNYAAAVQNYSHAQKVLQQYGDQPSFHGIREDCDQIVEQLKGHLKKDFQMAGKSAQSLTEIGELLLILGERPSVLSKEMLQSANQRLHEQIAEIDLLQDQIDRNMIEFVDIGIDGFLSDLTLVVTAYYDMFLAKHMPQEDDDFERVAREDLQNFVTKNFQKFLTLVQARVDLETSRGDSQVLLKALDRLYKRLSAMKNLCHDINMAQCGIDLVLNAAQQLCNSHLKALKDHFAESLNSIRLALITNKAEDTSQTMKDLIDNTYISTIEKTKGVLQDLLVFLRPEWSFNLKKDYKESLCVEGVRENLLVAFLRNCISTMTAFANLNSTSPPNLLLILSKFCIKMEGNGVRSLLTMMDELYDIDAEASPILTHESELSSEMHEAAQVLIDAYVRQQGIIISQMLRKSVETRDWLNCLEPRTVRAVMKRVVEELSVIDTTLAGLFDSGVRTTASSDSSRKTHFSLSASRQHRSTWSTYTPSQMDTSLASNIHRLFSEKVEIFSPVEFNKVSIITGIIKISLKTLMECIRLKTFSKFGLQQVQVDAHFLQMNLWRFVIDEK